MKRLDKEISTSIIDKVEYANALGAIIYSALRYDIDDDDYGYDVDDTKLGIEPQVSLSNLDEFVDCNIDIYGEGIDKFFIEKNIDPTLLDDDEIEELLYTVPSASNSEYYKWIYPLVKLSGLLSGLYIYSVYGGNVRNFIKRLQLLEEGEVFVDFNGDEIIV
jgi:hypothetical protein